MIKTREEINNAVAPYIIDKQLFTEVAKGELAEVASKFAKHFVILSEEQMDLFKKQLHISEVRKQVGKLGGRPRLPDLTDEEINALPKEERQRYKMRIWKRNSRQRSKNA